MTYVEELRAALGDRPLLLPSTALIVLDPQGRILLQRRTDDGTWGLPGGLLEIGEAPEEAVVRETKEEMGLDIRDVELFGVFGGKDLYHDYPGRGRVYSISTAYIARDIADEPRVDHEEVSEARFFAVDRLPANIERGCRPILSRFRERLGVT
jgi:ADP-ribose pyrophosphatase YjhB (NUDIX family)